ncbi:beta-lactamase-like protein [Penicillium manginii]|uniref:beta-lactamase-like protein n=1 Tax=Penicillium manginii TaxID=203109 RepID=UPI0025474B6D|nr:beta-lactamase-like protein [Penicillium manginii]KAJ5756648.1 beta-lactamase-like protein [Penicillium manginii]
MPSSLQVDVYVAPAIQTGTGHVDPSKNWFSPICCTLIQGPQSAVLVDTPVTGDLAEELAEWVKQTAPGKQLRYIYTTHAHGDHFFGNPVLLRHFPEAECVATPSVAQAIAKQLPDGIDLWKQMFPGGQVPEGQFSPTSLPQGGGFFIDGVPLFGIDVPYSDTEASSFLHVPELKLVVCGDIVYGDCYQFFGEASTSEKRHKWLQSLDQIASLDPHIVVPGHKRPSQVNGSYLISATREYILAFEAELKRCDDAENLEKNIVAQYPNRLNKFLLEWSCKSSISEV